MDTTADITAKITVLDALIAREEAAGASVSLPSGFARSGQSLDTLYARRDRLATRLLRLEQAAAGLNGLGFVAYP